jgi:hypothetical protein
MNGILSAASAVDAGELMAKPELILIIPWRLTPIASRQSTTML